MDDVKQEEQTPEVPQGATLEIDSSIAEPLTTEEPAKEFKQTPGAFMSPEKLLKILKTMVDSEQVTPQQARQMRQQFGIKNNFFTKPKVSREEKKEKKAVADASRRTNRQNGSSKGQKRSHGRGD